MHVTERGRDENTSSAPSETHSQHEHTGHVQVMAQETVFRLTIVHSQYEHTGHGTGNSV